MLTNNIPLERLFNNDKMWYEFVGVDKKGKPIIEEIPSGCKSILDNKHYYFSDDKEELYNYWVGVIANKPQYERMNEEYSKLLDTLDKKYINNKKYQHSWNIIPLFQYYQALRSVGEITLQQMLDGVVAEMETILTTLTVGKAMSVWSKDAHWTDVIADVKYNKAEKVLKVKCIPFFAMHHYTRGLCEKTFDLKTEEGFYFLGNWLENDRGYWESLDELIENYEKHMADIKAFISNIKRINSKKEKLYGKNKTL